MSDIIMQVEQVSKRYILDKKSGVTVHALDNVSLDIQRGAFTAIAGPSGSGKSTLLNLIGGLDKPDTGDIILAGNRLSDMSQGKLADFRRDHIGFIFQAYNLIPVLTVRENVEYVMMLQGVPVKERAAKVATILEQVGLSGMEKRRPGQLSGGQQQRVAVARAIVSQPDIILADEPTANLDSKTGSSLLDMMRQLNQEQGITFLFSTHDTMIMERARRLITLQDGRIKSDERRD